MDNADDPNGTSELVKLGLQPHNSNSNNRTILLHLLLKEDCLVPSDPSALGPMSPFTKEGQILRKSAGVPFILPGEAEMVITSPKVRSLCSDEECKHSKYSEIVNEGYLSSVVRNGGRKLISRWLHCVPVDDRLPDELIFSVECSSVSELFQLIEEAVANRIPQGLQWFRLKELHYTDMPVTVTDNREGTENAIPESISLLLSSLTEDKSTAATNSDDIPKSIMALINTKNDTVGDANDTVGDANDSVGDANDSVGDANDSVGDANDSVGEVSAPISCENGAVAVGKGDSIGSTTLSTLSSMKRVSWTILQRDASFTPETISVSMYQKLPSRVALDVNTSFNSTKSSGVSSIVSKDRECFSNQDKRKNRIPSLLQQIDEHLSSVPHQIIAKVLCFPRRISFVVTCILTEQDVKRIQLRNVASKTSKYKSRWNSSLVPDCCLSTNPTIQESSLEIDMNMPAELFQRRGTAMVATIGDLVNALRSLLNLNVEPHQILFLNPALHDERQKEQIPQSQGQTASNTSYYYPLEAISQLSDFIYIICDMCDSGSMYPGCGEKNILTQRSASLGSPYIDSLIAERNSGVRQNALGHGQQRNAPRYLNDIPRGERHGDQVMANEGLIHMIKKSSRQSCSSPYSSSCYAGDVKHEEFTRDSPQTSFNFKMDVRRPGRSPRRRSVSIIPDDNSTNISHLKEKAGHTKSINPDWFSAVLSEGPSLCHTVALHREELEEDMPLSPYSVNNLNSNTEQNLKTYIPIVRESIASSIFSAPIYHVSKTPAKEIESSITKRRRLIQLCLKMLMCHRKAEKYFTSDLMVKISGVIVTKYQKEKLPDGYEVNFPISFEDRAILDDTIDEVVEEWIPKVMTAADNKNKGLFQGKVSDGSEIFSADQLERAAAIAAVDRTNLYGPNFNYTPHENNDINDNKNTVNTSIQQTQSDSKDYITTPLCKPIVVDQSKYVPSSNKDPTKTPKLSDQSILPQNPRQLLITEPSWIAKEKRVVAFATCSIDIFGGTSEAFSITKHPFLAATADNNAGVRPPFRWWLRTGTVDSDHTVDMSLDALISLGIATMHVISRTVPITLSFEIDLDPERTFTIINEAAKSISKKMPSNVNKEGIDNNNTLRVPEHHDRYKKKMAYDEVIRVLINRYTFSTKPISVLREGLPYTLGVEVYDRDNEALIRCEKSFAIPVGAGLEVSSDELLDRIGRLRGLPYF